MITSLERAYELAACGLKVFPCLADKRPARPKSEGGQGFKDASTDRDQIRWLFEAWPAPLVGVATGEASDIAVLDIDAKHPAAMQWFAVNRQELHPYWSAETRSGGRHLFYRHRAGIRNCAGRPMPGIDVRGDGGYVIWWDRGEVPARWKLAFDFPAWVEQLIWPPQPAHARPAAQAYRGDVLVPLLRAVEQAGEGIRNNMLYWAAKRAAEHVARGEIGTEEARHWLAQSGQYAGLTPSEIVATLGSAGL